jgi:hypothetical protein
MTIKQQWFSAVKRSGAALGLVGAATAVWLSLEGTAEAQSRFGDKGTLAITGENLFALESARVNETQVDGDHTDVVNRFGLLYTVGMLSPRGPQVGAHYFIIPSLSLGGTIGYESRGGSHTQPDRGVMVTRNNDDESTFLFMPKVGYAIMFSQVVGVWFRGGLGYFRHGVSDATDTRLKSSQAYGLLSADALLVVTPLQHFGFFVGPQADFSLTGSHSQTVIQGGQPVETSWSASYRAIGLGVGLMGYFGL